MRSIKGAFGGERPDAQARYAISADTLTSLAGTDTENSLFGWAALTETTANVVGSDAPAQVQLAAINALGNLGDASAIVKLGGVFGKGGDAGMRSAAGNAIASICTRGQVELDEATFSALLRGTSDGNSGVRGSAFKALGSADLSAAQSMDVARANRPGEGGGAAADEGCGCGCGCGCGME